MTSWREFEPALAEVLPKLPDGARLVISGSSGLVQFIRDAAELVVEVSNESSEDQPRLTDRGWVMIDSWSGIWRRTFPHPATGDDAGTVVAETGYVLKVVFGWTGLADHTYASWREVSKSFLGLFSRTEEKPLSWPSLGLARTREDGPIND
ncbi:hypothetical protein EII34_10580 [Arachnia propionica]|uniref:TY-Chap N-terminal domain-containing protein n=1 Tax=Arachnia propionica TaxID=1750 RepID=A0A3P1T436_9ACTN|nr:hypothetical protein [Arachnia propionica]MDO5083609.1 hypothetical protein [Arachnia propionica]RRD04272.1 hypothetical protein EII34_10580 [Arachnia propionica]